MNRLSFIFLFTSFVLCRCAEELILRSEYGDHHTITDSRSVTIQTEKEKYGDWVTTISSYQTLDDDSKSYITEVNRDILEIDGKKVAHVKAVIKGPTDKIIATPKEKLTFHQKGAKNILISNNRTSATRINSLETGTYGGIITNRELKVDELFEVTLEDKVDKYTDSLGIGVTYHTPDDIDYLHWMMCGTIILYDVRLYENGVVTKKNYGSNISTLKIGDRVGVMKKSNGDVHFFINGHDQGAAKSGVTYPVHGVLDLYGNSVMASIV